MKRRRTYAIAGWIGVAALCLFLARSNTPSVPSKVVPGKNEARTTRTKMVDPGYGTGPYAVPGQDMGTAPNMAPGSGAGTVPNTGSEAVPNTQTGNAGGTANAGTESSVLSLVNAERSKAGLSPLTLNKQLSDVCRTKAQDMRDNNYFDHISPTYGSPSDMIKKFNIPFGAVGENIAAGQQTPAEVMQGWMNSEGHRRNILDPAYTEMGIGNVQGGEMGVYWAQLFINR